MRMNWKPMYRYQTREFLLGALPFFAVIAAVVALSFVGTFLFNGGEISFSGYGAAAAICMLVFGVVIPRQHLRIGAQFGVSRRTVFFAELAAALTASLALAAAGELLLGAARAVSGPRLFFADLYQLFYQNAALKERLTMGQHGMSVLFNTFLVFACFCFGTFFTCLFWRLSKVWTIITAVCIPLAMNGIPLLAYRLGGRVGAVQTAATAFAAWFARSGWNAMAVFAAAAALFAVIGWLLVRRVNIKAPTGK